VEKPESNFFDERIRADRKIEAGPKAKFSELLRLTAEAYGITERDFGPTWTSTKVGQAEVDVGLSGAGVG
jgi:hypothetical protein